MNQNKDDAITEDEINVSLGFDTTTMVLKEPCLKESISFLDGSDNVTPISQPDAGENIKSYENMTSVIDVEISNVGNTTVNIYENQLDTEVAIVTPKTINSKKINDAEYVQDKNNDQIYIPPKQTESCILDIENQNTDPKTFHKINNEKNIKDDDVFEKCYSETKSQFDSMSLAEPCCRVCQCSSEEENLISPCHCSGSVKWVHESCLVHWMKSSFKDSCELCLRKIEIAKRIKPLSKWTLPSRRPTPVVWVLVFVTAIALNLASIVKDASRLCSTTPCLVFYAVGCMGIILGSLFLIFWTKRARSFFNHWLEQNEEWVVILEKKPDHDGQDEKKKEQIEDPKI